MIASITGKVISHTKTGAIIATASGLGYEVHLTPDDKVKAHVGNEVQLFTYLKVSDQAQDLFGFSSFEARDFFTLLLSVSGVGPKTALSILSAGSIDAIQSAIARGDVKYLTAVQGMGKKTAERVVVELKSKLGATEGTRNKEQGTNDELGDVVEGLIAMGYSGEEARGAVQSLEREGKSPEALIREALRRLGR